MIDPLRGQNRKNPGQHLEHLPSTGLRRAKHHDTGVLRGRISPNVGEVQIDGEEHSAFFPTRRSNGEIVRPGQALVVNGVATPAGSTQKLRGLNWQVLVELRAHARILRREREDPFLREVCGIGQRRLDARRRERRVAPDDFASG